MYYISYIVWHTVNSIYFRLMTASSHSNKVQPMEMKLQRYSFLMWHLLFLRVFEPFFFFGHRIHALPVLFFLVVCLFSMHAFYARFINFIGVKNWGTGRNGRWFCKKSAITISIHNKEEVPYYLPSLHWSKISTSLLYFDVSLLFLFRSHCLAAALSRA